MSALPARLQPLFTTTKSVCFGRFLLDIPATAAVVYGPSNAEGGSIIFYPGEATKVGEHVANQLAEVEKNRKFLDKDDIQKFTMFGKAIDGVLPGQKLVFGSRDQVSYSIDSFIPIANDLFVQRVVSAIHKDETISRLNKTARNLTLRAENQIPNEPGICIDGGFLSLQSDFEKVSLGVRLKEFPDVHFSVEVLKNQTHLVEANDLESRLKQAEKNATHGIDNWYSRIKFLRRGPRALANWTGSEALAHRPANEDRTQSHEFLFISQGAVNDPWHPQLDVQLDTGVKFDRTGSVKPSLSDDEAIALWDKLIGSIRVRPTGAAATQSSATPSKLPLGEYVDTGSVCPQAGWWQCNDGGEIAGGRRQHFAAGDPVPHAFVLGKPSLWQMLKGERPTHKIDTIWKLVEYDSDPVGENLIAAAEKPQESSTAQLTPLDQNETRDAAPPRDA